MTTRRPLALALAGCFLALAARAQTGELRLVSQPGVRVVWESVEIGATGADGELLIEDIPLGAYNLALAKSGYLPLDSRVEITSGRTTVSLLLTLAEPAAAAERDTRSALATGTETAPPIEAPAAVAPEPGAIERRVPADAAAAPIAEAVAAQPPVAAPPEVAASGSQPPLVLLALAAALSGLLYWLWRIRLGRQATIPDPMAPQGALGGSGEGDGYGEAEGEVASVFRERLRRREAKLDAGGAAPRLEPDERIIDVVDFEVLEEPP